MPTANPVHSSRSVYHLVNCTVWSHLRLNTIDNKHNSISWTS